MRIVLFFFGFICLSLFCCSQNSETDSSKIKILLQTGDKFLDSYPDSALLYYHKAHKLAEKFGGKIFEVKALRSIGKAYMLMGNFSKADEFNFKSLKILDKLSSSSDKTIIKDIIKERASYYQSLGEIQYSQGNYKEALIYYQKELSEIEKIGDKSLIAFCYHRIGSIFKGLGNYPQAIIYYQKSLSIYETSGNKGGMATSYNNLGMLHDIQGNYTLAIEYYLKALQIAEELGDKNGISGCNNNIGVVYEEMKNYAKASEYYNKALINYEKQNNKNGMGICYCNIGVIHKNQGNHKQAIEYFKKSLTICEELGDIIGISEVLTEIANTKLELADSTKNSSLEKFGYYQEAIEFALRALNISKERNALPGISYASSILHKAYKMQGNQAKALEYAELEMATKDSLFNKEKNQQLTEIETKYQTEKKEKEIQLQKSEIFKKNILMDQQKTKQYATFSALILIFITAIIIFIYYRQKHKANALLTLKNNEITQQKEEILKQAEQLIEINKELEKLSIVASETDNSIVIFDALGKPEWVNEGFTRLNGYSLDEFINAKGDNLFKMSSVKEISSIVNSVITERKVVSYSCRITTKQNKNLWVQTTLSPVIDKNGNVRKIIAIDSDISKLKEAEEEIKLQKEEIEAQRDEIELHRDKLFLSNEELTLKNKQIIDSITYAQLIQEALLPDINTLKKYFPDSFIFFKPRNIVSGDFYWFHEEDSKIFFAVADCTGHGVPGAFMSMIGTTLLNEIVKNKKIYSPSKILAKLNQEINIALKQQDEIPKSQGDGMDITFFVYEPDRQNLTISMANQTIILICQDKVSLIKGDIYSVGGIFGSLKQASFTDHNINISTPVNLYLFTDGIKDQFNADDEKFGEERLQNLFKINSTLSMQQQGTLLIQSFNQWKSNVSQIDDVLVAGIKLMNC